MKTDIKFAMVPGSSPTRVEVYDVVKGQRLRVRSGEAFIMELKDLGTTPVEGIAWATINDPALKMDDNKDDPMKARIQTVAIGQAEVQVQVGRVVDYFVTIEVFNDEAVSLNLSADPPVKNT